MSINTFVMWLKRYRFPLQIFVLSRIVFIILIAIATAVPEIGTSDSSVWARWDGGWYITIARDGYRYAAENQSNIAFFPTLPVLMRALSSVTDNTMSAGLIVTNAALLGALIIAFALMRYEAPDDPEAAERLVLYLAFAPMAVFFATIYTESLFLLLVLLVVYAARRRWWTISIAAAIVASATRIVGVVTVAFIALEWASVQGMTLTTLFSAAAWRGLWQGMRRQPAVILAMALVPFGLFSYMAYLNSQFGDPLLFFDIQSAWGRSTGTPFAAAVDTVRAVFAALLAGQTLSLSAALNVTALVIVIGLIPVIWRRFGTPYAALTIGLVAFGTFAGLTSFFRYTGVMFPALMALALVGRRWKTGHYVIVIGFVAVYAALALLFISNVYFE